ncbi:Protein CBG09653 [Caenorhabditis briggsae]|uniref:Protein CBG09653 n=1 Tax=Caenorhabditis briggsae TaxID=6238 RepID=A8X8J7_CAEBR|nr:Protein CBG09653 [Caenorhabditis briggsae]CAP28958.2 Protein CBG09653 [Caenorhabditis briggsae]
MSNPTSSSIPTNHTIFTTPASKKYSVCDAEHSYFYIPPCKSVVQSEKPLTVFVERNAIDGLELEWIKHSPGAAALYVLIAIVTVSFYATCFLLQYGNYAPRSRNNVFDEAFLTRVVIVQWLVLLAILFSGVFLYRRLFMPLYIFLSVMATNGTLVLFVLKVKQLIDEKITISVFPLICLLSLFHFSVDISLNMLGLLLFCAVMHDIVYFYAMHLKLIESRPFRAIDIQSNDTAVPNQYSTIHSSRSSLNKKEPSDIV